MGDKPVKLGSLTLLLTVVLICLATLSVLAISTARADYALASKHAEMIQKVYGADALAQRFLAEVDRALSQATDISDEAFYKKLKSVLPEEAELMGDMISALIKDGEGRQVAIELDITGHKGYRVIRYKPSVEWKPQGELGQLWDGQ